MKEVIYEFKKCKTALLINFPFISAILNKARVIMTTRVPTAAITEDGTILINPEFFMNLQGADRIFTIAHETLHWAFRDLQRGKNKKKVVVTEDGRTISLWNIVTDAVNNDLLGTSLSPGKFWSQNMITISTIFKLISRINPEITLGELTKLSKEQIYKLLEELPELAGIPEFIEDLGEAGGGSEEENEEGVVIQEGDPEFYNTEDEDKKEELMKQYISEAYSVQKQIGKVPGKLKRIVDEILKSKISWRTLLRSAIVEGLGKTYVTTYSRESRKQRGLPGYKRFTVPTVHVGIDTSGSISDKELSQFLGEIVSVARGSCDITVTFWDAIVYETIKIKNPSQIKTVVARNIKGGGGTAILPFLRMLLKNIKPLDIVIVFTDGYIYDIDTEARKAMAKIAQKASKAVFVTTGRVPEIPRSWKIIELRL